MVCIWPDSCCRFSYQRETCRYWRFNIFFSQRRQDRQELQCLICSYPKQLCVLCALARFYCFISLAKAQRPPRTSLFVLFLPQTPLRALRLCESLLFLSLAEAQRPQWALMFDLFLPQIPLRTLRLGEIIFVFFLLQRRRVRREFQCFVLTPNTFACFAPWRE